MKKQFNTILSKLNSLSYEKRLQGHRCKKWIQDNGDKTLRLSYKLNSESIIYDVGGFHGDFTSDIYNKYGSKLFVFEPIGIFFEIIKNRFLFNENVKVFQFGLGASTRIDSISLLDNSSSLYAKKGDKTNINIKSIIDFISENRHLSIDLIKINIEGGEYELLESLIDNNLIHMFKNIQVQFHDFVIPRAEERMVSIQEKLSQTHFLTWQYKFVWENWEIKGAK